MKERKLFTSESVTEGHPDKMCDQISDAILDAVLKDDPDARVAIETVVSTGLVLITGELTTNTYIDIPHIVRETIRNIGYTNAKYGFDADTVAVLTHIDEQSQDIAESVNLASDSEEADELGAGDQGLMFGFATNETKEYMPLPIVLAHKLAQRLAFVRKKSILDYLRPDGKTQVTVEYDENNKPIRVDTIVISTQHDDLVSSYSKLKNDMMKYVIQPIVPSELLDKDTTYHINPSGRFIIGGPQADAGLTGRKIIVDTYGGYARHGGGAKSGKDATKVDRSGAYAARYVAKNIVAAKLADKCEVQLAYAIGLSQPVSIMVDTFGTGKVSDERLTQLIRKHFDLTPSGIIKTLDLKKPIYKQTATYGHFGRTDLDLPWERTDKVHLLLQDLNEQELKQIQ